MTGGPRIIAADPLHQLAGELRQEAQTARAVRDERGAVLQEETAKRLEAAIQVAAAIQDVSTDEAAPLMGIHPESVAAACRRGKFPGARKVSGKWRVPVAVLTGRAA